MLTSAAARSPAASYPRLSADEVRQRQFELNAAHQAATHLIERVELCIGSEMASRRLVILRRIRSEIAVELLALDLEVPT